MSVCKSQYIFTFTPKYFYSSDDILNEFTWVKAQKGFYLKERLYSERDGNNWNIIGKDTFNYSENGIINEIHGFSNKYNQEENNWQFVDFDKIELTYDSSNRLITALKSYYYSNNTEYGILYLYNYNQKNTLINRQRLSWDSYKNEWKKEEKVTYLTNSNDRIDSLYSYNTYNNEWDLNIITNYFYENNLLKRVYDFNSDWQYRKKRNIYYENGKIILNFDSTWSNFNQNWLYSTDTLKWMNDLLIEENSWYLSDSIWVLSSSEFYKYNIHNELVIYKKNEKARIEFIYDEYGNLISEIYQSLVDSNWNSFSKRDYVYFTLSNVELKKKYNISLSPNPASDYIEIKSDKIIDEIEVFDVLGIKHPASSRHPSIEGSYRLDVSVLQSGVYFVRVGSEFLKFVKY